MWGAHDLRQRERELHREEEQARKQEKRRRKQQDPKQRDPKQQDPKQQDLVRSHPSHDPEHHQQRTRRGHGAQAGDMHAQAAGKAGRHARVSFAVHQERAWEADETDEGGDAALDQHALDGPVLMCPPLCPVPCACPCSPLLPHPPSSSLILVANVANAGARSWKEAHVDLQQVGVGVGDEGWGRPRGVGYSASFALSGVQGSTRLPPLPSTTGSQGAGDSEWPFVDRQSFPLPSLLRGPKTPVILM